MDIVKNYDILKQVNFYIISAHEQMGMPESKHHNPCQVFGNRYTAAYVDFNETVSLTHVSTAQMQPAKQTITFWESSRELEATK